MKRRTGFFSVIAGVLLLLGVGQWMDSKAQKSDLASARSVSAPSDSAQEQSHRNRLPAGAAQASVALEIEPVQERVSAPVISPKKPRTHSRAPASVH